MAYSSKSSAASIMAAKQLYGKLFEQNVCAHLSSVGFFGQTGVACMKSSLHPENWAKYLTQSERQIRFYPGTPLVVCTRAFNWHQQQNIAGYKKYVATNGSPALLKVIRFATKIEELLVVVRPEMQALEPMNIVVSSEEPANEIDDFALIFSKLEIDDDVTPMSY